METNNPPKSQIKSGYGWPSVGLGLWLLVIVGCNLLPTPTLAQACVMQVLVAAGLIAMYMRRIPTGEIGQYLRITQTVMLVTVLIYAVKLLLVILGLPLAGFSG